jgi:hypothetical protein
MGTIFRRRIEDPAYNHALSGFLVAFAIGSSEDNMIDSRVLGRLRRRTASATAVCCCAIATSALAAADSPPPAAGAPSSPDLVSTWRVAASDTPASRDALFGDDDDKPKKEVPPKGESRDALFGDGAKPAPAATSPWRGFVRGELAYTYADPAHWSKMLIRSELDAQGALGGGVKYKVGARLDYDFVYDATDFYPSDVRRDQRVNFLLRENYLDFGAGDFDFRIGRQQIVWGEMVGLFFADVVSAKDLREFILPDFDVLRIPQWAGRVEYFKDDFHAEAIWIPVPSYDNIGKPGSDFFPAAPPPPSGFATLYDNEQFPDRRLAHTNYGLRLSWLRNGWDVSGFYYGSMDTSATFYRQIVSDPQPAFLFQARHDRIQQFGATLAKDVGAAVFKAEAVYTHGRSYNVQRLDDDDGVVAQNTLDVVGGLDFTLPSDTRLNVQLFDRVYFNHDPDIVQKAHEPGASLLVNHKLGSRLEAEVLWIMSLIRNDWMLRPKLAWDFQPNWRLVFGADIFQGPQLGLFGQFANRDRVYTELRYSF